MFYHVVFGYCGPDNCTSDDDKPILEIKSFDTLKEVEDWYYEFMDDYIGKNANGEKSKITFRVFKGEEIAI